MSKQNNEQKTNDQEEKKDNQQSKQKRQIIIETDGNSIELTKAEVAGSLELKSILSSLLRGLDDNNKK